MSDCVCETQCPACGYLCTCGNKELCALSHQTTEPEHPHVCPACGDSWLHRDSECDYTPVEIVPGYPINQTWAACPMHEGRDE